MIESAAYGMGSKLISNWEHSITCYIPEVFKFYLQNNIYVNSFESVIFLACKYVFSRP